MMKTNHVRTVGKLFQQWRHVNARIIRQQTPHLFCNKHTQTTQQNPTTLKKAVNAIGDQQLIIAPSDNQQLNNNYHLDPNNYRVDEQGEEEVTLTHAVGITEEPDEEVTLRPFKLSDIDDVMGWDIDEKAKRFYGGCYQFESREKGLSYLKHDIGDSNPSTYAICLGNRPVGEIYMNTEDLDDEESDEEDLDDDDEESEEDSNDKESRPGDAYICYMLAAQWRGRGVATRAVKIAVADVFEKRPKLQVVQATVNGDNVWSQRVLERAGFSRVDDGKFRSWIVYSVEKTLIKAWLN